jgi:ABC-2 type transport system ATP-binding protein
LDPVGRREVREIILQLRDEGRTVIFSSHILSDAELLCSRIGILAKGRLRASGSLAELTDGAARGFEMVVAGLSTAVAEALQPRVAALTRIDEGRYSVHLGPGLRPEPLVAELAAAGASLVSVSPLRTTLEDVFMEVLAS